jgi:putative membrane protein
VIIRFSTNRLRQIGGVARNNASELGFIALWGVMVFTAHRQFEWELTVPVQPVSLLGGGLAIFLGFRNNSAYDRWWEARKIWGGVVNASRTFSSHLLAFLSAESENEVARRLVYRHLAYINALRLQLRESPVLDEIRTYLDEAEWQTLGGAKNVATMLAHAQAVELSALKQRGLLTDMEHYQLIGCLERFYDLQGMAERIKKTVFPYFYVYFTRTFLLLFVLVLPLSLVPLMDWHAVPLCLATSFVFVILDKTGAVAQDPLDARSSGTPMSAICRVIEIDLRQMLGEQDLPPAPVPKTTRHGALFLD